MHQAKKSNKQYIPSKLDQSIEKFHSTATKEYECKQIRLESERTVCIQNHLDCFWKVVWPNASQRPFVTNLLGIENKFTHRTWFLARVIITYNT